MSAIEEIENSPVAGYLLDHGTAVSVFIRMHDEEGLRIKAQIKAPSGLNMCGWSRESVTAALADLGKRNGLLEHVRQWGESLEDDGDVEETGGEDDEQQAAADAAAEIAVDDVTL